MAQVSGFGFGVESRISGFDCRSRPSSSGDRDHGVNDAFKNICRGQVLGFGVSLGLE